MSELDEVQQRLDDVKAFAGKIERNKGEVDVIMVEFRTKKIEAENLFQQLKNKLGEMCKVADAIARIERWDLCVGDYKERMLIQSSTRREKANILYDWGYR